MEVYQKIACMLAAIENCSQTGNGEWEYRHQEELEALIKEHLPSGGGFNTGTTLLIDESTPDRLEFFTEFQHMTEHGYDGWTSHRITVSPSLAFGFELHVDGEDRNEILEYIEDVFHDALTAEV